MSAAARQAPAQAGRSSGAAFAYNGRRAMRRSVSPSGAAFAFPRRRLAPARPVAEGWRLPETDPQTGTRPGAEADRAAMRAIAAGDEAAFAALMARETPGLLRFARGLLGDAAEAEDVVQDSFVRLWENAGAWRPEAAIRVWLHRVCRNGAVDRLRRRRAHIDIDDIDLADDTPLPEAGIAALQDAAALAAALAGLPERQRSAILLFHIQEMSQIEAAGVLEVSETAFESLLARGRRNLRRLLGAAGGDR